MIDDGAFAEIKDALLAYKVLFFRNQSSLTPSGQAALARRFGEIDRPGSLASHPDEPDITVLENTSAIKPYADYWHTDFSYKRQPAMVSILRARLIPALGGDTLWANMEAAYEDLSDERKAHLGGLTTFNTVEKLVDFGPLSCANLEAMLEKFPPVDHPIVRTHPETGRRSIYSSINTAQSIPSLPASESTRLLDELHHLCDKPEYQCRLKWGTDTVAMWDNRCTRHYATTDYYPQHRIMERVIVRGEVPF